MDKLITKINSFNNNSIDFEPINNSKNIYNIYNNSVDIPFHKFWFHLDNTKFVNMYYDFSTLRFAINAKNNKVKKTIEYIKNIANYMTDVFKQKNIYDNITIDLPIKETSNYPVIISLKNKLTSMVDSNNNSIDISNINNNNLYSVVFEISFIKVIKNTVQDFKFNVDKDNVLPNASLKFYLNIVKIQEENSIDPLADNITKLNLNTNYNSNTNTNTNTNANIISDNNLKIPPPPFINELISVSNKTIFKPPTADELLNKKTFLKKINKNNENINKDYENINKDNIDTFDNLNNQNINKNMNDDTNNVENNNYFSEIGKVFLEKKKSLKKVKIIKGDSDYNNQKDDDDDLENYSKNKNTKKHKSKKHKKSHKIQEVDYDENIENEFANFTK